ncbi:MAG: SPFH/Band 7/PHB domain protein [Campylobacterales bacterium]|nr:SPFH/Band 7/PHB domain protein [Campylobacterales bacterium]
MDSLTLFLLFLAAVVFVLWTVVKMVPQGEEWVVERLGKFHGVLKPGLNVIVPFVDIVQYKLSTKEQIQQMKEQEVITEDNAVVIISAVVFYKITDLQKAVYSIQNFQGAVANMVATTLRSVIGGMKLDDSLSGRDKIKAEVKDKITEHMGSWGLTLSSVEVQDIRPSANLQEAMEKQAAAEREKKALIMKAEGEKQATIAKAEGAKQSMVLEAEGKLEAAKKEAEAKVALAEGDQKAMATIATAVANGGASFLLAQRYIDSLKSMSASDNAKVVFIPADMKHSLEGVVGGLGALLSDKDLISK